MTFSLAVQYGGGGAFQQILINMQTLGFFQFLFPFLLALAIVFGLLQFSIGKRLGRAANALIAMIVAFFVMLYSSWNYFIVQFFANLAGTWLIVATGILFILILLGLVGFEAKFWTEARGLKWAVFLLIIFIGIVLFFGAGAGYLVNVPTFAISSQFWTIIFFIVILALVIFWLGTESEKEAPAEKEPEKK